MRPACGLDNRARPAAFGEESVEAGVGIGLADAGISRKLLLRVLPFARGRVVEHRRWRGLAAEWPVIAHMRP
jgi:hypothetical protein